LLFNGIIPDNESTPDALEEFVLRVRSLHDK